MKVKWLMLYTYTHYANSQLNVRGIRKQHSNAARYIFILRAN